MVNELKASETAIEGDPLRHVRKCDFISFHNKNPCHS